MNIKNITLKDGLLIVEQAREAVQTASGILLEENTDDFLVHATVVNSNSKLYKVGAEVIYHILDSESLRDGKDSYSLVQEDKVKGTYVKQDSKEGK